MDLTLIVRVSLCFSMSFYCDTVNVLLMYSYVNIFIYIRTYIRYVLIYIVQNRLAQKPTQIQKAESRKHFDGPAHCKLSVLHKQA